MVHRRPPAAWLSRLGLATAFLAAGLGGPGGARALPSEEAILPVEAHTTPEMQRLARDHAAELVAVRDDLRRCAPGLPTERHGIGFRRPRFLAATGPHLALWVWLGAGDAPLGADLPSRAAAAFQRHGRALFRVLTARSAVAGDERVAGYGIVLTWLRPGGGDPPVGETLVVAAGKSATVGFARQGGGTAPFLSGAAVRAFDGQTDLGAIRLPVANVEPEPGPGCP